MTQTSDDETKYVEAIEAALAETLADLAAGRFVKESPEAHLRRLESLDDA